MDKLFLPKIPKKGSTINRTIRFDGDIYDRMSELSESTGMTFNKLVNVCLRFALDNTEQENEEETSK